MRNIASRSQRMHVLLPLVSQGSFFVQLLALPSLLQVRTSSVTRLTGLGCLSHGSGSSPNQVPEKSNGFVVSNGVNEDTFAE